MARRDSVYEQFKMAATGALLRWVLAECGGDRTRAAKLLGLSRAGFYKLLHQHGILGGRSRGDPPATRAAEDPEQYKPQG